MRDGVLDAHALLTGIMRATDTFIYALRDQSFGRRKSQSSPSGDDYREALSFWTFCALGSWESQAALKSIVSRDVKHENPN